MKPKAWSCFTLVLVLSEFLLFCTIFNCRIPVLKLGSSNQQFRFRGKWSSHDFRAYDGYISVRILERGPLMKSLLLAVIRRVCVIRGRGVDDESSDVQALQGDVARLQGNRTECRGCLLLWVVAGPHAAVGALRRLSRHGGSARLCTCTKLRGKGGGGVQQGHHTYIHTIYKLCAQCDIHRNFMSYAS